MAQFQPPFVFTPGIILTAAQLNAHISSAIALPGLVSDQTAITAFDIESTDTFIIYDASTSSLRKATIDDLMRSGQIAKFDNISGKSGQNLAITPAGGYSVAVNGNLTASGTLSISGTSALNGNVTAGANLTVTGTSTFTGNATFNSTEALKLPIGTTGQRPLTPATGQFRYNTSNSVIEIYNGTDWVEQANKTYVDSKPIAKAWVKFAGATGTIADSFNVASVSRTGVGSYTVNLTSGLANANFAIIATCSNTGGTSGWTTVTNQTNSSASIYTAYPVSYGGAQLPYDPSSVYLVIFGN